MIGSSIPRFWRFIIVGLLGNVVVSCILVLSACIPGVADIFKLAIVERSSPFIQKGRLNGGDAYQEDNTNRYVRWRTDHFHALADHEIPINGSAATSLALQPDFPSGGTHNDVVALFRRDPPTEKQLEIAIELIEDAVMPLANKLPRGAVLVAASDVARDLVNLSTRSTASHVASLRAFETLFEHMALAARRGAWSREFQLDASLAAGVLILREFMHHAGFDRIELQGGAKSVDGVAKK